MLICIKNLCFSYKKKKPNVLNNISIDISEKGIDAFLGHNGAGKTTLFLLISGHLKMKTGNIIFNSQYINSRKEIAIVPEKGGYFDSFTPSENLRFRYLLSDQPEEVIEIRIKRILNIFGLDAHDDKLSKHLSSGLQKRLAIACALICKPKLLLLDEPTNGIDPVTNELLIKTIKQLSKKNTKILFNTHDLNFVSEVADQVTILNNGKIVAEKLDWSKVDKIELKKIYFQTTDSEALDYADI